MAKRKKEPAGDDIDLVSDGMATLAEAYKFLGLGETKVRELMLEGKLRFAKFGRSRRIPWKSLREYAAANLQ